MAEDGGGKAGAAPCACGDPVIPVLRTVCMVLAWRRAVANVSDAQVCGLCGCGGPYRAHLNLAPPHTCTHPPPPA